MSLEAAFALLIAKSIISQLIKDGPYKGLKNKLFPRKSYESRLHKLVIQVVDQFEKKHPPEEESGKYPFYQSEKVFIALTKYVIGKEDVSLDISGIIRSEHNIQVPQSDTLQEFYELFFQTIKADDRLKVLFREENYQSEIFRLGKLLDATKAQLDEAIPNLKESIWELNEKVNSIRNSLGVNAVFTFHEESKSTNFPPPPPFNIDRKTAVGELTEILDLSNWMHIHGPIQTGKTQLASRIAQSSHLEVLWLTTTSDEPISTFDLIRRQIVFLSGCKTDPIKKELFEHLKNRFPNGGLLVLDELLEQNDKTIEGKALKDFLSDLLISGFKILSTGHTKLSRKYKSFTAKYVIKSYPAPQLTIHEINEMLATSNCDAGSQNRWGLAIKVLCKGNIQVANSILAYLVSKDWNQDPKVLNELWTGEYDPESKGDLLELLAKTIQDNDTIELLFRLYLVIGSITTDELDVAARAEPAIKFPQIKLQKLNGMWVSIDGEKIVPTPLIPHLNLVDLDSETKRSVRYTLGQNILDNKTLNPQSAINAILYFKYAEAYEKSAFVLLLVLQASIENPEMFYDWKFTQFWYRTPLPQGFPFLMKILIRTFQISIAQQQKKDPKFLLLDLELLLEEPKGKTLEIGFVHHFLAIHFVGIDSGKVHDHLRLIKGRSRSEFQATESGEIAEWDLPDAAGIIWHTGEQMKTLLDAKKWFSTFDSFDEKERELVRESEHSEFGSFLLASKMALNEGSILSWIEVLNNLEYLDREAEKRNLVFLYSNARKHRILICLEKLNDREKGVKLANETLSKVSNPKVRFLIHDAIGRGLKNIGDNESAISHLAEAVTIEVTDEYMEKADTYFATSEIFAEKDQKLSIHYARKAVEFVHHCRFFGELAHAKALGELSTALGLAGLLTEAIETLEKGYVVILGIYEETDEWKAAFMRFGNSLLYWSQEISAVKYYEGQVLTKPYRQLFTGGFKDQLPALYFPQRKFMAITMLVQIFEKLNNFQLARKWAMKLGPYSNINEFNPLGLMVTSAVPYLIQEKAYTTAVGCILKSTEDTSTLQNLESSEAFNADPELGKQLDNLPKTSLLDSDELILTLLIAPAIFNAGINSNFELEAFVEEIDRLGIWLRANKRVFKDSKNFDDLIKIIGHFKEHFRSHRKIVEYQELLSGQYKDILGMINYSLASVASTSLKDSLALHSAMILRIENVYRPSMRGTYLYIISPFFLGFWEKRFAQDRSGFPDPIGWMSKAVPYYAKASWEVKLRKLFRTLAYHFEHWGSKEFGDWVVGD